MKKFFSFLCLLLFSEFAISQTENGHEYVDLGLSVYWASCNIGDTIPTGCGSYYAWGETSSKSAYDWDAYNYCQGSLVSLTKYCTDSRYGTVDNRFVLEAIDDAARVNWGGNWRMPTVEEMQELVDSCVWNDTLLIDYVRRGFFIEGKNGNSIFLPAAGVYEYSQLYNVNKEGFYWTSSIADDGTVLPSNAFCLYFEAWRGQGNGYIVNNYDRMHGMPIRAVLPKSTPTNMENREESVSPSKIFQNGHILILSNGRLYNIWGQQLQEE